MFLRAQMSLIGLATLACVHMPARSSPAKPERPRADPTDQPPKAAAGPAENQTKPAPKPFHHASRPTFPEELFPGVEGWADAREAAYAWGGKPQRLEHIEASVEIEPGLSQRSGFVLRFDRESDVGRVTRRWGEGRLVRDSPRCRMFWFNEIMRIRAEVRLKRNREARTCDSEVELEKPEIHFEEYLPYSEILPRPDGRFAFEPPEGLIGLQSYRLMTLYGSWIDLRNPVVWLPPVDDAPFETRVRIHLREGLVEKFTVESLPAQGVPTLARNAFEQAFGQEEVVEVHGQPHYRFRGAELEARLSHQAGTFEVKRSSGCVEWTSEQINQALNRSGQIWVDRRVSSGQGRGIDYTVKLQTGWGPAVVEEISPHMCGRRIWRLLMNKPDCDQPEFSVEEVIFEDCCEEECRKNPHSLPYRFMSAVAARDLNAVRNMVPASGTVIRTGPLESPRRKLIPRRTLTVQNLQELIGWHNIPQPSFGVGCEDQEDGSVLCKTQGAGLFIEARFDSGVLLSFDALYSH